MNFIRQMAGRSFNCNLINCGVIMENCDDDDNDGTSSRIFTHVAREKGCMQMIMR